jgi:hypothetical protein
MKPWSKDETQKLIRARQGEYPDPWSKLAKALNRTYSGPMQYKCVKKKNLKAKWTRDELDLLKKCLGQYIHCGQLHNDFLDTNQETHSHKNAQAMQGETRGMEP